MQGGLPKPETRNYRYGDSSIRLQGYGMASMPSGNTSRRCSFAAFLVIGDWSYVHGTMSL